MKKTKIMLTAFALVAVIGGTFAFKAAKFSKETLYITDGSHANDCNSATTQYTRKSGGGLFPKISTASSTGNCVTNLEVTTAEQ